MNLRASFSRWHCGAAVSTVASPLRIFQSFNIHDAKGKIRSGGRRGFAPRPTRGMIPLDPQLPKLLEQTSTILSGCFAGLRTISSFWPQESWENPRGKASFLLGIFSAFPGCFASGLAALPPGQKHNGKRFGSFQQHAGKRLIAASCYFLKCGSRAVTALVGGLGAESPQRSLCSYLLYAVHKHAARERTAQRNSQRPLI